MVVLYFGFLLMLLVFALEVHADEGRTANATEPDSRQIPLLLHTVALPAPTTDHAPVVRPRG